MDNWLFLTEQEILEEIGKSLKKSDYSITLLKKK